MSHLATVWAGLLRAEHLPGSTHKLILLALADRHNVDTGVAATSIPRIAKYALVDERTVYRILPELEAMGLVEKIEGTPGRASSYRLPMVPDDPEAFFDSLRKVPKKPTPGTMSPLTLPLAPCHPITKGLREDKPLSEVTAAPSRKPRKADPDQAVKDMLAQAIVDAGPLDKAAAYAFLGRLKKQGLGIEAIQRVVDKTLANVLPEQMGDLYRFASSLIRDEVKRMERAARCPD